MALLAVQSVRVNVTQMLTALDWNTAALMAVVLSALYLLLKVTKVPLFPVSILLDKCGHFPTIIT